MSKRTGEDAYNNTYDLVVQVHGTEMTSNHQLDAIAKDWAKRWGPTKWLGAVARDQGLALIEKMPKNSCLILNTHNAPGVHWVAVMRFKDGLRMSYDSFGRSFQELFGQALGGTEDDAEQEEWQEDCGQRCLAWLLVAIVYGPDAAKEI